MSTSITIEQYEGPGQDPALQAVVTSIQDPAQDPAQDSGDKEPLRALAKEVACNLAAHEVDDQIEFFYVLLGLIGQEIKLNKKGFSFVLTNEKDMNGVEISVREYPCQPLCVVQQILGLEGYLSEVHAGPVTTRIYVHKPMPGYERIGEIQVSGELFSINQDTDGILHELFKLKKNSSQGTNQDE